MREGKSSSNNLTERLEDCQFSSSLQEKVSGSIDLALNITPQGMQFKLVPP